MINGNSVVLQMGKETTYGTAIACTNQIQISNESLKEVYNKIEEGLAVGGRGVGKVATMGIGVEGSVFTLFRPDMGLILKSALGVEVVASATEGYKHTFTAIENDEEKHLPSLTVKVDRKVDCFSYPGCKIGSLTLSAENGNYLLAEINFNGKQEITNVTLEDLTPSTLKAFKFAGGKFYVDDTEIADVTSVSLEINNNLTTQVQTSSTGDYYKEPEAGMREITANLSMLYSASAELLRKNKYKTDDTFALKLEFVSDEKISSAEKFKMVITLPCCQMNDATANMSGLDTLPQDVSIRVVDNLEDELITVELYNSDEAAY